VLLPEPTPDNCALGAALQKEQALAHMLSSRRVAGSSPVGVALGRTTPTTRLAATAVRACQQDDGQRRIRVAQRAMSVAAAAALALHLGAGGAGAAG
jgi:hypothetical protein